MSPIPTSDDGFAHTLTSEQKKTLKDLWALLDAHLLAPGSPSDFVVSESQYATLSTLASLSHTTKKILETTDLKALCRTFWLYHKNFYTPDIMVLKFLRARKWDVEAAFEMIISALEWRLKFGVEDKVILGGELVLRDICEQNHPGQGVKFQHQYGSGKAYFWGHDKLGRPVIYIHVRLHSIPFQTDFVMQQFTISLMEVARTLTSNNEEIPCEQAVLVFDMTDFTLSNMDFHFVKFLTECFEARYPETLGAALIHKAPWVFWGAWKIIQPWIDPIIATKVHFTKTTSDLVEFIDINQLPTCLGGSCPYDFQYILPDENEKSPIPLSNEEIDRIFTPVITEYESALRAWINKPMDQDTNESQTRLEAGKKLQQVYLEFDTRYRALTFYNRIGVVPKDNSGNVNWDFSKVKEVEKTFNPNRIVKPCQKAP